MSVKILTIDSESRSVQKLGFETICYPGRSIDLWDKDIILRWGNSALYYDNNGNTKDFKNVINKSSSIKLNCKKHKALIKLGSVVDVPKIYLKDVPKGKTVVVRPFSHTGGQDFRVVVGPIKIQSGFYATEYIKANREFRVWFCGDDVFSALRVPAKNSKKEKYPCRSKYAYKFCKTPAHLKRLVLAAAKTIGLQIGAADVLKLKRKFYFLELNSAPTCDSVKIRKFFKSNLDKLIEKFPETIRK